MPLSLPLTHNFHSLSALLCYPKFLTHFSDSLSLARAVTSWVGIGVVGHGGWFASEGGAAVAMGYGFGVFLIWFEVGLCCIAAVGLMLGLIVVMGLRVDSLMVWVWWWVYLPAAKLMGLGGGVWLEWFALSCWGSLLHRRCGLLVAVGSLLGRRCGSAVRFWVAVGVSDLHIMEAFDVCWKLMEVLNNLVHAKDRDNN